MKTNNVQITATAKEFKNGKSGWTVYVEGMSDKVRAEMNFTNPLKAMRYMFVLSKRLSIKINEVELLAISLQYKRSKSEAEQKKQQEEVENTVNEVTAETVAEEPQTTEAVEEAPKAKKPRRKRTKKTEEEKKAE